jgi:hypothetical protein
MLIGMMPVEYLAVLPALGIILVFRKLLRFRRQSGRSPSGEAKKRDPSYPEPAFKEEIRFLGRCMYCGGKLRLFSNICKECGREN